MPRRNEYPPLESLDVSDMWEGMEGLDMLLTKHQAMDMGVAALAGAGGTILSGMIVPKLPWLGDTKMKRAFATLGVGLAGGRLLWNQNREMALGFAGAVAGNALKMLVSEMTGMDLEGLGDNGDDDDMYMDLSDPVVGQPSFADASVETAFSAVEDEELLGLSEGMGDATVETDNMLGAILT